MQCSVANPDAISLLDEVALSIRFCVDLSSFLKPFREDLVCEAKIDALCSSIAWAIFSKSRFCSVLGCVGVVFCLVRHWE